MLSVKNAMITQVYTLSLENSITDLVELLSQRGIGSIVIVNGDNIPLQIFTLRDIPKIFSLNLSTNKIKEILLKLDKKDKNLITIKPNQNLMTAMHLMNKNNISHLPVINKEKKLVGILSMRDLLRHFPSIIFTDPLTQINNRMYLDIIRAKIEKTKVKLGVLMLDIDNFKKINDKYGHSIGDVVLKEIAKSLKKSVKSYDEVIRYGGEEFLVILYRCEEKYLPIIGDRLRNEIKKIKISGYESLNVTVSIGACIYNSEENLYNAIDKADKAMYQAKKEGKDRVVWTI
ncbi:MAG: GGDEF domain-containing protein [Thermodesulfovibrio sp.]|nr:GGDEF domain-containing protein [Thermodesulfovibrio sp.]